MRKMDQTQSRLKTMKTAMIGSLQGSTNLLAT